ncbi:PEGA domain-containing protein [Acidobacteria bacterium AH-259-D05]|nr:PEGA domain-containing protein [Acidobacteria bacterium AH-259-D05]
MPREFKALTLVGIFICLLLPTTLSAQMTFKKVEARTAYGRAEEGKKGKLIVDGNSIRFVHDKNERDEYFSIPSKAVTDVFYSRVSGRRIKTAIFLTGPLGLFLKGKKHYMTLSFNDGGDIVGAVEFKLDKKNYRGVLRAVEQVSGVDLVFDQEGIKDEKETVASRSGGGPNDAILEINSDPEDAEIEIDGAFAGTTPRSKQLRPGEYKIKISKKGYKSWERKITVETGETIPLTVQLEEK